MAMIFLNLLKEIILWANSLKWTILGIPTQPHHEKSKLAKIKNPEIFKNRPTSGTPTKSLPKEISYTFLKKKKKNIFGYLLKLFFMFSQKLIFHNWSFFCHNTLFHLCQNGWKLKTNQIYFFIEKLKYFNPLLELLQWDKHVFF